MSGWDVAVVGAGIAGLTAARTCAEHGLRTVAYDRLAPGGQLINLGELTGFPTPDGSPAGGPDFAGALLDGAMSAGVEVAYGEVSALAPGAPLTLTTDDGPAEARAVIVATGLTPGRLDIPDADAWVGRGLSECATCDGPLHAGRDVVVAGGDEWAAREAIELAGIAAHVTVVAPGPPAWTPAAGARLTRPANVDVRTHTGVAGLDGDAGITEVRLTDGTSVKASAVFVYTGKTPRRELLDALPGDAGLAVYPAGDVASSATPYLLTAAADGLRTGLAVCARLLA